MRETTKVLLKVSKIVSSDKLPLMGILGAFIFAAQMVNFQLPAMPGTSGHLVGAVLLAIILGPHLAAIVISSVVIVQCLIFQDGGLLAMGANILNMAFAGVLVGYLPYHLWGRRRLAVFAGGAFSVLVTALLALAELLISIGINPASRPERLTLADFARIANAVNG